MYGYLRREEYNWYLIPEKVFKQFDNDSDELEELCVGDDLELYDKRISDFYSYDEYRIDSPDDYKVLME